MCNTACLTIQYATYLVMLNRPFIVSVFEKYNTSSARLSRHCAHVPCFVHSCFLHYTTRTIALPQLHNVNIQVPCFYVPQVSVRCITKYIWPKSVKLVFKTLQCKNKINNTRGYIIEAHVSSISNMVTTANSVPQFYSRQMWSYCKIVARENLQYLACKQPHLHQCKTMYCLNCKL